MKTLLVTLSLTLSVSAFSALAPSLTFNEIYLDKNGQENDLGIQYKLNRDLKTWCRGFTSTITFGAFEAAEKLDNMADGFYRCDGKFVQASNPGAIQVFAINGCSEISRVELKADCLLIK